MAGAKRALVDLVAPAAGAAKKVKAEPASSTPAVRFHRTNAAAELQAVSLEGRRQRLWQLRAVSAATTGGTNEDVELVVSGATNLHALEKTLAVASTSTRTATAAGTCSSTATGSRWAPGSSAELLAPVNGTLVWSPPGNLPQLVVGVTGVGVKEWKAGTVPGAPNPRCVRRAGSLAGRARNVAKILLDGRPPSFSTGWVFCEEDVRAMEKERREAPTKPLFGPQGEEVDEHLVRGPRHERGLLEIKTE